MPDRRILTVPDELSGGEAPALTGNEFVSLPEIDRSTAAIQSLNVLHMGSRGLIEFRGDPLLRPNLRIDGGEVEFPPLRCDYEHDFVPRLQGRGAGFELSVAYCAPPGFQGFFVVLELKNLSSKPIEARLGVRGRLSAVSHAVFSRREVRGPHRFYWNRWSRAAIFEANTGLPVAAWSLRGEDGTDVVLDPELPAAYRLDRSVEVVPGDAATVAFYCGVGPEGDAAGLHAVDLVRHGWRTLLDSAGAWLAARRRELPDAPGIAAQLNRNLFFSLFFAAGRTIDTGELVLVTSRSPRYYVSAAHWTRDSLLWAFPAALAADFGLAREWLVAAFRLYARNPGVHALYIDGGVLYPGFELDELCAFFVALDGYLRSSGDASILADPAVARALPALAAELRRHRDPESGLGRTFLLSSDDPAHHPYVTYDNALLWKAYRALAAVHRLNRDEAVAAAAEREAAQVRAAVRRHCVVEGPFGPMFCGSADLRGNHVLYDEPPGSLELLPYYEFTDADDPVQRNTVAWIYSEHNPHFRPDGRFSTPACPHADHPWVLSLANGLLAGRDLLDLVAAAPMDGGFACETIDRETGHARTGAAFATCAGWLAHAILTAWSSKSQEANR